MYDITICVLASSKNKKRLDQFLEIGLSFFENCKLKIVYLASEDDEKPNYINEEWLNIKGPISSRFLSYLISVDHQSKWFFQVDDDSCTDVNKTLEITNYFYDYKDPIMIHGSCFYSIHGNPHGSFYMESSLQNILKKMNIKNMFLGTSNINDFKIMPRFKHSWEQTLISLAGANKIKSSEIAKEFLHHCIEESPQYGDQVPYVAAKLAKVPIDENFIFCPLPIGSEYSAINKNGRYTHIHHVLDLWDELDNFKNIIRNKTIFEDKKSAECALENKIIEKMFWYFEVENKILGIVKLEPTGDVGIYKNKNEVYWKEKNENIIFLDSNKIESSVLKRKENNYEGFSIKTDHKICLKKIDVITLIGMEGIKSLYA